RAFTRSASALFQVKRGSSKLPETCSTKTSFSCFLAIRAASLGVSTNSTLVPKEPQECSLASFSKELSGLSEARTSPQLRSNPATVNDKSRRMSLPPWGSLPSFPEYPECPRWTGGDPGFQYPK